MSRMMLHGLGDCTRELHCGCLGPVLTREDRWRGISARGAEADAYYEMAMAEARRIIDSTRQPVPVPYGALPWAVGVVVLAVLALAVLVKAGGILP